MPKRTVKPNETRKQKSQKRTMMTVRSRKLVKVAGMNVGLVKATFALTVICLRIWYCITAQDVWEG